MAPSPACSISFDENHHGVFFAGQRLSGTVDIVLPKQKKVKGVLLKITGLGCVRWTETYGTGTTVMFSGREDFLTHTLDLVRAESEDPIELPPGRQIYRFSIVLPNTLPTSFEGDYGYIRYTVRVIFERPWKIDLTYKIAFTVVNQLNLNSVTPPLNVAVVQEHIKRFSCGPCRSAPLTINVMLPMTGYVPGQFILVTVDVSNQSGKCITEMKLKLRRQVQYRSKSPYEQEKSVYCTLAKYQCSGVDARGSAGYERRFLVPPEPPTRNDTIIRIAYFVEVTARVVGMACSPSVRVPVTIGTVPLRNLNKTQQRASIVEAHLTTASTISRKTLHGSVQSLKIPHTFEKATGGKEVSIHDDDVPPTLGAEPFAPRYPMFQFDADNIPITHGKPTAIAHAPTTKNATGNDNTTEADA
ncbi:arrestin domain-containing protein 17-like [Anopheles ziemanni]|uniref:arrestin domain-containing protein 17-like n=1 Tax=Anopheles coustani TaxID=139045 RepID=UPI00265894CF|nr:arrestin domain-containing protein 17-like [Anopheles coustani]XP_058178286.1 arrestin domain-containing protein 17-like [Anopheles ziemanni]